MSANQIAFLLPLSLFALASCDGFPPVDCPLGVNPGIVAEVRDAATAAPAAHGARGLVWRAGNLVDSLRTAPTADPAAALEMVGRVGRGTYRVTVEKAGYRPWAIDRVEVPIADDECGGVRTSRVSVLLERLP